MNKLLVHDPLTDTANQSSFVQLPRDIDCNTPKNHFFFFLPSPLLDWVFVVEPMEARAAVAGALFIEAVSVLQPSASHAESSSMTGSSSSLTWQARAKGHEAYRHTLLVLSAQHKYSSCPCPCAPSSLHTHTEGAWLMIQGNSGERSAFRGEGLHAPAHLWSAPPLEKRKDNPRRTIFGTSQQAALHLVHDVCGSISERGDQLDALRVGRHMSERTRQRIPSTCSEWQAGLTRAGRACASSQ